MNAVLRLRRRIRRADRRTAAAVAIGNVVLLTMLLAMAVGVLPGFEVRTREQESAVQGSAARIFGCWLAGGLLLFAALGTIRALLAHLATMLAPPALLILILASRM
ncbi:hypothetical protein ACIQ9E_25460 [Streptomyces sp. NPDC094448]|uniref:hypothetical protein n=1 Tax=Streptomyces sp. NPDC094448 TaxID=3366063 RepID=UPI00382768A1